MPTYAYRCKKGHAFDQLQSITAAPLKKCPKCGAKVERLISGGTGLIFKGSGFYITDYKNKKSNAERSKADAPKSEPSKPAPKPKE